MDLLLGLVFDCNIEKWEMQELEPKDGRPLGFLACLVCLEITRPIGGLPSCTPFILSHSFLPMFLPFDITYIFHFMFNLGMHSRTICQLKYSGPSGWYGFGGQNTPRFAKNPPFSQPRYVQ
jgi:hypothetical protein